ncbi:MAG: LCP family protein [Saccharofermentanales bacterium]
MNYLIFGIDALTENDKRSRTDSMIIVSVDSKNNSIKLTSIMRDTQVDIEGRSLPNKINAAYVFGGIGLMINTINQTFDLDIQKFGMVDMWSSEGVIDGVGGVYIDVTSAELYYVNHGVTEANEMFRDFSIQSPLVPKSGRVLLNGRQAVAYGRIRYIGSDTARTQRQRNILTQLIVQFKASPLSSKLGVFDKIAQSFESNITKSEMVFLAFDSLAGMKNIQQYRIPQDGMYTTNMTNYQMRVDLDRQIPALHEFIWGDGEKQLTSLPDELPDPTATAVPTATQAPTDAATPTTVPSFASDESAAPTAEPTLTLIPTPATDVTP